jgi:hypothetical protein
MATSIRCQQSTVNSNVNANGAIQVGKLKLMWGEGGRMRLKVHYQPQPRSILDSAQHQVRQQLKATNGKWGDGIVGRQPDTSASNTDGTQAMLTSLGVCDQICWF